MELQTLLTVDIFLNICESTVKLTLTLSILLVTVVLLISCLCQPDILRNSLTLNFKGFILETQHNAEITSPHDLVTYLKKSDKIEQPLLVCSNLFKI